MHVQYVAVSSAVRSYIQQFLAPPHSSSKHRQLRLSQQLPQPAHLPPRGCPILFANCFQAPSPLIPEINNPRAWNPTLKTVIRTRNDQSLHGAGVCDSRDPPQQEAIHPSLLPGYQRRYHLPYHRRVCQCNPHKYQVFFQLNVSGNCQLI